MPSTRILVLAAVAGLTAPPDDLVTLWKAIQKVDIDDTSDIDWRHGDWILTAREDHAYKVRTTDGEVRYTEQRPRDNSGIQQLWQRRFAREVYMELGRRNKTYDRYWAEMTWVAEERKWVLGGTRSYRWKRDDALFRKWFTLVRADQRVRCNVRKRDLTSWIRTVSSIRTSRERIAKLESGRLRGSPKAIGYARDNIAISTKNLAKLRARIRDKLLAAGKRIGAGDAVWLCAQLYIEITVAGTDEHRAAGLMRATSSLAGRRTATGEAKDRAADAKAAHEAAKAKVARLRRARRSAMARVMRAFARASR